MRTIPKQTKRDGKKYLLHSREGAFAIYREPRNAGFLLARVVFVPERLYCYSGKVAHERLGRPGDGLADYYWNASTLAEIHDIRSRVAAQDKEDAEIKAVLSKGGYAAQKLRKRIAAEDAAAMQAWKDQQPPQPERCLVATLPFAVPKE